MRNDKINPNYLISDEVTLHKQFFVSTNPTASNTEKKTLKK